MFKQRASQTQGLFVPAVTPLRPDRRSDVAGLACLIHRLAEAGLRFLLDGQLVAELWMPDAASSRNRAAPGSFPMATPMKSPCGMRP